ncbi:MAG: sulfatase activating formylglycine-generating enzyme [Bradymonadia bacterium]
MLCVGGARAVYAAQTEVDDTITQKGPYGPEMIVLPAGKFTMGSPAGESDREDDEAQVEITCGFALGRSEVTQAQWAALMGGNPSYLKGDDRPVERVNWYEALTYLNRLSESEGLDACYGLGS